MGNKPSSEWPIALIGLDNAGKTAFVNCVVNGESTGTTPTIGYTMESKQRDKNKLLIFDMPGQRDNRHQWSPKVISAQIILYVVDSLDKQRINESRDSLSKVIEAVANKKRSHHSSDRDSQTQQGYSHLIAIIVNKRDKDGSLTAYEVLKEFGLSNTFTENDLLVRLFETIAVKEDKEIEGVKQVEDFIFNYLNAVKKLSGEEIRKKYPLSADDDQDWVMYKIGDNTKVQEEKKKDNHKKKSKIFRR